VRVRGGRAAQPVLVAAARARAERAVRAGSPDSLEILFDLVAKFGCKSPSGCFPQQDFRTDFRAAEQGGPSPEGRVSHHRSVWRPVATTDPTLNVALRLPPSQSRCDHVKIESLESFLWEILSRRRTFLQNS